MQRRGSTGKIFGTSGARHLAIGYQAGMSGAGNQSMTNGS
jgi:hypothetical protein